jgi:hypothetical protein
MTTKVISPIFLQPILAQILAKLCIIKLMTMCDDTTARIDPIYRQRLTSEAFCNLLDNRYDAIKFVKAMQRQSSDLDEETAWKLVDDLLAYPFGVFADGWIARPVPGTNIFAQIELVLGAQVAWRSYTSYLIYYQNDKAVLPDFLLDDRELRSLTDRAGFSHELHKHELMARKIKQRRR